MTGMRTAEQTRAEHPDVEAALDAVGVYAVEHDLSRAFRFAALCPFHGVDARGHSAPFGIDLKTPSRALGVYGEHNALVAVTLCRSPDEGWGSATAPELTLTLSAPHLRTRSKSERSLMPPPTVRGDEHLRRDRGQRLGEEFPALVGRGDVVKDELVRARSVVKARERDGIGDILQPLEFSALDHSAVLDVQGRGSHVLRAYALLCRGERGFERQRARVYRLADDGAVQPHARKRPYLIPRA